MFEFNAPAGLKNDEGGLGGSPNTLAGCGKRVFGLFSTEATTHYHIIY
jgi:hypothetical protein